jgi:MinD superfamily P-loop ATPase
MSQKVFHGVPREKIPWHPSVNYEKCVSCGECADYCKLGVYELEEKKVVVKNPNNCVVYCNGCDAICRSKAITHPSKKETAKLIIMLRKTKNSDKKGV